MASIRVKGVNFNAHGAVSPCSNLWGSFLDRMLKKKNCKVNGLINGTYTLVHCSRVHVIITPSPPLTETEPTLLGNTVTFHIHLYPQNDQFFLYKPSLKAM